MIQESWANSIRYYSIHRQVILLDHSGREGASTRNRVEYLGYGSRLNKFCLALGMCSVVLLLQWSYLAQFHVRGRG